MQTIIVSDTSCLILFEEIQTLDILQKLFGKVYVTSIVADEFGLNLPEYIKIKNPDNPNYQLILETILDPGESSSLALALENKNSLLIIDDLKGRKEAKKLGISITGSIGVIIAAKNKGIIPSLKTPFKKISKTNFRINQKLIDKILKEHK